MKKILFITLINILFTQPSISQEYETLYAKSYKGKFCGEESFDFSIFGGKLSKKDKHYGNVETVYSQRDDTTFDDNGNYIENWSVTKYLEEIGYENSYNVKKYWYTLAFDKKGGNLLYILELKSDGKTFDFDGGKFYFTQLGYERYCKKTK